MNNKETKDFLLIIVIIYTLFFIASFFLSKFRLKKGKLINEIVLPDILQNNFPNLHKFYKLIDYYIIIWMIIAFSYITFGISLNLALKGLIFLAVIFGVKEIFGCVTILPDSSKCCETKNPWGFMGSCNNLGLSGHVASMLAVTYILSLYIKEKWAILLYLQTVLYGILIVLTKNHYALDILVSFVVVDMLWTRVFIKYIL